MPPHTHRQHEQKQQHQSIVLLEPVCCCHKGGAGDVSSEGQHSSSPKSKHHHHHRDLPTAWINIAAPTLKQPGPFATMPCLRSSSFSFNPTLTLTRFRPPIYPHTAALIVVVSSSLPSHVGARGLATPTCCLPSLLGRSHPRASWQHQQRIHGADDRSSSSRHRSYSMEGDQAASAPPSGAAAAAAVPPVHTAVGTPLLPPPLPRRGRQ